MRLEYDIHEHHHRANPKMVFFCYYVRRTYITIIIYNRKLHYFTHHCVGSNP